MMKTLWSIRLLALGVFSIALIEGCKKENTLVTPPSQAHFTDQTVGSFYVRNVSNSTFKIPVGVTTVSNVDRKINISVSTNTGAVAGTQYNVPSTTVTIPAGKTIDSLTVQGLFAGYPGTRKDTLIFTITGGDVTASDYNKVYKLVLQRYCDVDINLLKGFYTIQDYTGGAPDGGPYQVEVTDAVSTGTNKATLTLVGLWGITSPSVKVDIDWNNPSNFTTNVEKANWFYHPTYGQSTINPAGTGTFSSCDNTLLIRYEATVSAGSFGKYYSTLTR